MAKDELFTREQYLAAGWTDEQLVQAGKMHFRSRHRRRSS
jgi:hypothetical protein